MEAPKRGRGRPSKMSKQANEMAHDQQQGSGEDMMDVEPAQPAPTGGEGAASSADDNGAKTPKKRGREPSIARYSICLVEDGVLAAPLEAGARRHSAYVALSTTAGRRQW